MRPETAVDWTSIPGPEWYRPEAVPIALAAVGGSHESEADPFERTFAVLSAIGNNHCGTVYPAAVPAVGILLRIALGSPSASASRCALAIIGDLLYFGAEPGYEEAVIFGVRTSVTSAIREQVAAASAELASLAAVRPAVGSLAAALLRTLEETRR